MATVRALTFDVFGTVVDWRSSVIRELEQLRAAHNASFNPGEFVDAWRYEGYMGGIGRVRRGELPFQTADALHRRKLDELLDKYGLGQLPADEREGLNRAWHRLDPWPDSVEGLARLRSKFIVSTLSNGNFALLVNMARHAHLGWDSILSADVTGAFKPDPDCYLAAARFLDLQPAEVMMVAAHKTDLKAAQAAGLQAAFVPRPTEAGPNREVDLTPVPAFQFVAKDFNDLADQLGCA